MIDLAQIFAARQIISAHGRTYVQLYKVPGDGPAISLCAECTPEGQVTSPAAVFLVLVGVEGVAKTP